jgi:hypothetical protein
MPMKKIQAFQTEVYSNKIKYKVHRRMLIMLLFHGSLYKCNFLLA